MINTIIGIIGEIIMSEFFRFCVKCNNKIFYKNKEGLKKAIKRNIPCKSCSIKESHKNNPDRMTGSNNPMSNNSQYKIWIEKYGIDKANEKLNELKLKRSKNAKGSGNPMYGKPPGKGAGRGISGKYKNLHFRSSYELCFLIKYENDYNCLPTSAETLKFKCSHNEHNFYPDFYDKDTVYEIKPKKLIESNKSKLDAIREYCLQNNLNFKLITEDDINLPLNIKEWIINLYKNNIITLTEKQLNKVKKQS